MKKLFYETEEFLKEKVEKIESKIFASVVNNYNTIATSLRGCHSTIKTSCNDAPSGIGQNIKLTLGGQLTAKGRDLGYVLGKENFKTSIMGG